MTFGLISARVEFLFFDKYGSGEISTAPVLQPRRGDEGR
jgi:hypothetical protein